MADMMHSGGGQSSGPIPSSAQEPLDWAKRAAQGFAIAASLGAGFSTFVGLRDFFTEHSGIFGWLLPISIAAVLTLVIAFCWHLLLEMASHD